MTDRERSGNSARTAHPRTPDTGQKGLEDVPEQPKGRVKVKLVCCLSAEIWQVQGIQQALKDSFSGQSKSVRAQIITKKERNKQKTNSWFGGGYC